MRPSLPYKELAPEPYQTLLAQWRYTRKCGLEASLLHLVEIRASQINGCTFCMDMHATEATEAGESPRRLHTLAGWREAPWFTPRERAALAWTEALTKLPDQLLTTELEEEARAHFSDKELVDLTHAIALINVWNRLSVAFLPALPGVEVAR
jgi:AhpD family alkylhydroperoxidase